MTRGQRAITIIAGILFGCVAAVDGYAAAVSEDRYLFAVYCGFGLILVWISIACLWAATDD